jgi:hypothetical protein
MVRACDSQTKFTAPSITAMDEADKTTDVLASVCCPLERPKGKDELNRKGMPI